MKYRLILLISILLIGNQSYFARQKFQSDSLKLSINYVRSFQNSPESIPNRGFFGRLAGDLYSQLTAVFHMSKGDAIWVGSGLLATGALISTDQGSYNTIRRTSLNNRWMGNVSPYISQFGALYGVSVVGLFASYGLVFNDSKALETSYLAAESFITSGIFVRTLKLLSGRERPSSKDLHSHEPGGEWWGLLQVFKKHKAGISASSFDSFPSGHTASAFSIAAIIAHQYSGSIIVPIISYSLASLVAVARIVESTHWTSDVLVGGVIGYLTSVQILNSNPSEVSREKYRTEYTEKKKLPGTKFSWSIDPINRTLSLAYHF